MQAVELKWYLGDTLVGTDTVIEPAGRRLVAPAVGDEADHVVDVRRAHDTWTLSFAETERPVDGARLPLGPYQIQAAVVDLPSLPPDSLIERLSRLVPSVTTLGFALVVAILVGSLAPPLVTEIWAPATRWVRFIPVFDIPAPEILARDAVLQTCQAWGEDYVLTVKGTDRTLSCAALVGREQAMRPIEEEEDLMWSDLLPQER